ncbi:hypothetical protein [Neptuniibacter sp. QD48_11]|uniref:hypothetical protein n=1 Tax=Neptuniibacter sp. QD48_11 TaxID=3398211 RepID=UPI0039F5D6D2
MARKKINTMLKTTDGVFNTLKADVVTPTDKGVAILNANGDLMCWIEVQDPDLRKEVSKLVSDRVYSGNMGDNVEPIDWEAYGLTVKGKKAESKNSENEDSATEATTANADATVAVAGSETEVEADTSSL